MRIQEFAEKYCPEIIDASRRRASLFDLSFLPFDEIIEDTDGTKVQVIHTDHYSVPIMDIITAYDRDEFAKQWPYAECLTAYDNYVSNICIVDGPEVFSEIQRQMIAEMNSLRNYSSNHGHNQAT